MWLRKPKQIRPAEPASDWSLARASESWPIRIKASFRPDLTTDDMGEFADWLEGVEAPGPCRRLTHFQNKVLAVSFPDDGDPGTIDWWLQFLSAQDVLIDVKVRN
jgi:hypothetical protein